MEYVLLERQVMSMKISIGMVKHDYFRKRNHLVILVLQQPFHTSSLAKFDSFQKCQFEPEPIQNQVKIEFVVSNNFLLEYVMTLDRT